MLIINLVITTYQIERLNELGFSQAAETLATAIADYNHYKQIRDYEKQRQEAETIARLQMLVKALL